LFPNFNSGVLSFYSSSNEREQRASATRHVSRDR